MITEIFIENKKLDVNADISSLLTFAIDDIKDFASRSTAFSKTVVLPGTANNNAIFGNIFETGIANTYDPAQPNVGYNFNASKSAKCIIFQDNLQTFKGTIRLLEVIKDKKNIEYEVALNGELTSLNVSLSSGFLTDLNFSVYNQLWSLAHITASWDNTPGSGIYYPLIDFGTYSTGKHDWDFRTFRPALYVKEYIDKMFAAANFRYTCALFDTDRFKRLIVPHNQQKLTKLTASVLNAYNIESQHIIQQPGGSTGDRVLFGSIAGGLFTNDAGKTFTYVGTTTITATLDISFRGYFNFLKTSPTDFIATVSIRKNGVNYYVDPAYLTNNTGVDTGFAKSYSVPITLATGDYFDVFIGLGGGPLGTADIYLNTSPSFAAELTITSGSVLASPLDYNELIEMSQVIPKNIRQVDFLVSIVKIFNLYVYEDKFDERLIHMTPFIDFYSAGSGSSVDWTYKMNRDVPAKVKPLSEINSKIYNFNYKDDSDYYNDLYKKRYNQGYGSHIYDTQFEFASQSNKLELIFASTPLVGYEGEEKVYPTIFKRSGIVEENIDSVIRIMQTKKVTGVTSWSIKNAATVLGSTTAYGYAGHFDNPDNPQNDLNFGVLQELFFRLTGGDLTKTQFNVYWSSYMAEVADKDSKMLVAKFYLTAADIFALDFSKYVYVEGALFRLNKITDYNATVPSDCTVELLKVINTAYSFPPGTVPVDLFWIDYDDAIVIDSDNAETLYI